MHSLSSITVCVCHLNSNKRQGLGIQWAHGEPYTHSEKIQIANERRRQERGNSEHERCA